jgi:hypothetical protein
VSRRAISKPAKGGLANVCFGRLSLADAPGELAGLADGLTILFPWGTLLGAVAAPVPAELAKLAALCRAGAELRCVFGYDGDRDPATEPLRLVALQDPSTPARIVEAYRDAGFHVSVDWLTRGELSALPTSWAKKLAHSHRSRRFLQIRGHLLSGGRS